MEGGRAAKTGFFSIGYTALPTAIHPLTESFEKFGDAALGRSALAMPPIVSAVKFYTYGQAAWKRFAVSLPWKIVPSNSERVFPRHRAPSFPRRCFS